MSPVVAVEEYLWPLLGSKDPLEANRMELPSAPEDGGECMPIFAVEPLQIRGHTCSAVVSLRVAVSKNFINNF